MKVLSSEIEINAPAERVWAALMECAAYPQRNPFVWKIEGGANVGERLNVTIQPSGGSAMNFKPVVVRNEEGRSFAWVGKLLFRGLFDGRHEFVIEPAGEGRLKFIQREEFSGILVPFLWGSLNTKTRRGFEEMNAALKKLIEGN
jgi:hypothetical protein